MSFRRVRDLLTRRYHRYRYLSTATTKGTGMIDEKQSVPNAKPKRHNWKRVFARFVIGGEQDEDLSELLEKCGMIAGPSNMGLAGGLSGRNSYCDHVLYINLATVS